MEVTKVPTLMPKSDAMRLAKGEGCTVSSELHRDQVFVGFKWPQTDLEITASCVLYDEVGEPLSTVYPFNPEDSDNEIELGGLTLRGSQAKKEDNVRFVFKLSKLMDKVASVLFIITNLEDDQDGLNGLSSLDMRFVTIVGDRELVLFSHQTAMSGNAFACHKIWRFESGWRMQTIGECFVQDTNSKTDPYVEMARFVLEDSLKGLGSTPDHAAALAKELTRSKTSQLSVPGLASSTAAAPTAAPAPAAVVAVGGPAYRPTMLAAAKHGHELAATIRWWHQDGVDEEEKVDVDIQCMLFDKEGECLSTVWMGMDEDEDNDVKHGGDDADPDAEDTEVVTFKIASLQPNVYALLFLAVTFSSEDPQAMKMLKQMQISLTDKSESQEVCAQDIQNIGGKMVVLTRISKEVGGWEFRPIGASLSPGEDESPEEATRPFVIQDALPTAGVAAPSAAAASPSAAVAAPTAAAAAPPVAAAADFPQERGPRVRTKTELASKALELEGELQQREASLEQAKSEKAKLEADLKAQQDALRAEQASKAQDSQAAEIARLKAELEGKSRALEAKEAAEKAAPAFRPPARPPRTEPTDEERAALVMPQGVRPELVKAIQAVVKKGWTKVKFPHDYTPLHLASRLGDEAAVVFLLKAGAWPGLRQPDDKGMRPVDYAEYKGHKHLVELLKPDAD